MTDGKIHIGKSPLTDIIYAGKIRQNKNGSAFWSGAKHDVTSDFLNVMIQLLKEKNGRMTIEDDDCDYVFTMITIGQVV